MLSRQLDMLSVDQPSDTLQSPLLASQRIVQHREAQYSTFYHRISIVQPKLKPTWSYPVVAKYPPEVRCQEKKTPPRYKMMVFNCRRKDEIIGSHCIHGFHFLHQKFFKLRVALNELQGNDFLKEGQLLNDCNAFIRRV